MNTTKINNKTTLMIGHRGVCGLEPENSIPSFVAAGNRSYYGIEADVHVTKDGKFVIIHDDMTGRVAGDDIDVENSSHDLIRKITLNNICTLEEAEGIDVQMRTRRLDLIIPSLEEYISICKKYEKQAVLELKSKMSREVIKKLEEEISALDYLDKVTFISFSFANMECIRELLPKQELQFLRCSYSDEVLDRLNKYHLDLDIGYLALTKEIVDEVHANGHKVNCWTCNDKEAAEMLVVWGVDFITSNILE